MMLGQFNNLHIKEVDENKKDGKDYSSHTYMKAMCLQYSQISIFIYLYICSGKAKLERPVKSSR